MTDQAEPQTTRAEADPPPADGPTAAPAAEPAQASDELLCTICGLRACWRA